MNEEHGRSVTVPLRVRFGETDAAGIVYYPTFFTWFDLGTHALLRSFDGRGRDDDGRPRWMFPIVECGATFVAPLFYDDEIEIVSTVARIGSASLRLEHVVQRGDQVCGRGFEARVYVQPNGKRLVSTPIPADLYAHLRSAD